MKIKSLQHLFKHPAHEFMIQDSNLSHSVLKFHCSFVFLVVSFSTYNFLRRTVMSDDVVLRKTLQTQSPSASRHPNAPPPQVLLDELIMEILSWLPVKTLLKLRCVCKSWKSIISNPNFVKLHLQKSARNVSILIMWERNFEDYLNLNIVPCTLRSLIENPSLTIADDECYSLREETDYYVVGSCNGLVCWVDDIYGNSFREYWFHLWNPATKLTSPKLAYLNVSDYYRFAFGYDSLSDTYKVIAFRFDGKAKEEWQKIQVKICSFGENRWRDIASFPVAPFATPLVPGHNDGVYVNGTLNWLASCNNFSDDYEWNSKFTIGQLEIVSLDMGTETYKHFSVPCCHDYVPQAEPVVGVLMGCLSFSYDSKGTNFVVWQMKEFGVEKSWTQFMKFSYLDLHVGSLEFPLPFPLIPLCMSENGDVMIMSITIQGDSQAILYNRRDNSAKRTELPKYICWNDTKDYIESLVSPYRN